MYLNAALLAVFALLYALVSGRVERSRLSGPIVFVLAGLLLGPASGVLALKLSVEDLRVLAELTLAVVLFCDAANADFARIRHRASSPGASSSSACRSPSSSASSPPGRSSPASP